MPPVKRDHVILYRQISMDGASPSKAPFTVQAYCACNWQSSEYRAARHAEDEAGNHLLQVWLSEQENPV